MIRHPRGLSTAAALVAVLLTAAQGRAQDPQSPWLAWTGCWVPVELVQAGASVCFVPMSDPEAVEIVTVMDEWVASRETARADGERRTTSREGCEGTEELQISEDGLRLFTRTQLTCADGARRTATGVMAMVSPTQWMDVRSVSQEGSGGTTVQFYQLAAPELDEIAGITREPERTGALRSARIDASTPPTPEAVAEANRHVDGAAVAGWLVETGQGFDLDGHTLVQLADAGVDDDVIDVMIALSYPGRFELDRSGRPLDRTLAEGGQWEGSGHGPAAIPFGWAYSRFNYGYPYYPSYYSGSGYWYRGSGYWYQGYRPVYVDVKLASPGTSSSSKVVNGRGYTQGRTSAGSSSTGAQSGPSRDSGSSVTGGTGGTSGNAAEPRKAKRRGRD